MFQKGLALKQKKIQSQSRTKRFSQFDHRIFGTRSGTTVSHTDSPNSSATVTTAKKPHPARSVTLSSVLLAQRFSSTLLAPVNKSNLALPHGTTTSETSVASKKQHNPRRHVFATSASTNENQNPVSASGEKVNRWILKSFVSSHGLSFSARIQRRNLLRRRSNASNKRRPRPAFPSLNRKKRRPVSSPL